MLYVMRHGKTDWNAACKLQGRTDIPLNEEGREMAYTAQKAYQDVHFDICFCSPLSRARETAEILLAGRDVPMEFDDRLMEMSFGKYEGLANSFEIPDCPINILFKDPGHYEKTDDAESLEELFARAEEFLKERVMPLLAEGKDVLVVAHGALNSAIVCKVKNRNKAQFWDEGIDNCKLYQLI